MRPFACWDCGFESRRGMDFLSCECCVLSSRGPCAGLVSPPSPTECDVSECDREASIMRRPWPTRDCCAMEKTKEISPLLFITSL
jgi:hypothetical protein